ncbi:hypothetical protein PHYBOEH_005951 [Phytophthora boehmeriae]|uniref:M96 mating-specific protein family n=1 Tax=Phytophthora boehmeriae TaxID=109152 RepID=A0A8T1WKQ0_9STRA|nr:hypothetical protein PHYBOEH_005951 [Phytophthora boehmeriae]
MTSLARMDPGILDELVDFLQTSEELAFPTAFALNEEDQKDLFVETAELLSSPTPDIVPPDSPFGTQASGGESSRGRDQSKEKQRKPRSKDAIRRSLYRERQKREKEELRREIDELSNQLAKLESCNGNTLLPQATDMALSNCLWKAIATRQHERRRAAEDEQQRLRTAINSRASLIEDLCGFMRKRVNDGPITNGDFEDMPRVHKRMRLEPTDSALFDTFIQELHAVYSQADRVIKECEAELSSGSISITKHKEGSTEYYQRTDRISLPFNFQQTCHSMWRMAYLKHRQVDREMYDGMEDPDNTIAMKFRVTNQRMGETVSLLQRVVVRRFAEPNRVVVVWKVFAEGEGVFRGMHSDETGWCIARPSTSSLSGTILDICDRQVPMHFSSSTSKEPVVNEFTQMVLSTGEEENLTAKAGLEKMLLDDALENTTNF